MSEQLPFMSDDTLCEVIERLRDAKGMAEAIDLLLVVECYDDTLSPRIEAVRKLAWAIENAAASCSSKLDVIHDEWIRRALAAEGHSGTGVSTFDDVIMEASSKIAAPSEAA
jgi:hypothetical protein